jgi:hypothetical protein
MLRTIPVHILSATADADFSTVRLSQSDSMTAKKPHRHNPVPLKRKKRKGTNSLKVRMSKFKGTMKSKEYFKRDCSVY